MKPSPNLLAMLALRQHELNKAQGINRVTPQVALLLAAYGVAQAREHAAAPPHVLAYLTLQETTQLARAFIAQAKKSESLAEQTEYLAKVKQLQGVSTDLVALLKEMSNAR